MTEDRPEDAVARPRTRRRATLDDLLEAAARPALLDAEAAERAVAAFRVARDSGALSAAPRPADDWRTPERRRRTGWVRPVVGSLAASLLLGGVAMATGAVPAPFDPHDDRSGPAPRASGAADDRAAPRVRRPGTGPTPGVPVPRTTDGRPSTAKDQIAHCRAYQAKGGRGNALDATLWDRLEAAAGSPSEVAAYCKRLLKERPRKEPRSSGTPEGPGRATDASTTGRGRTNANSGSESGSGTNAGSGTAGGGAPSGRD